MPKEAFGGYAIDFTGRTETLEDVFGTRDLPPAEMTKRLWDFVKKNGLERRPAKPA